MKANKNLNHNGKEVKTQALLRDLAHTSPEALNQALRVQSERATALTSIYVEAFSARAIKPKTNNR